MICLPHVNFVSSVVILRVSGSNAKTAAFKSRESMCLWNEHCKRFWGETPVHGVLWTWELADPAHPRMPRGGPLRGDVTHSLEGKDRGPNGRQFPPLQCFSEPVCATVHCDFPRGQRGVPAVSAWFLRPWNAPPLTRTRTPCIPVVQRLQTRFGKCCLHAAAVMSKTSLPSRQPRPARRLVGKHDPSNWISKGRLYVVSAWTSS